MNGVLVIDKPQGMTSHDVVARVRRDLKTKSVGHAGTLDPLATGVLLVLVGEATKLAPYLTAAQKVYSATIALGVATDSLDADGEVTARAPIPPALLEALNSTSTSNSTSNLLSSAISLELARTSQVPPTVSAIHVDGVRAHKIARKNGAETLSLPPRVVRVNSLRVISASADPPSIDVELDVDKGYYVRSFARDFAEALGTLGHVARLRRTASGAFTLADATPLQKDAYCMLSVVDAARRALPVSILTDVGVTLARHGKALPSDAFVDAPTDAEPRAWLSAEGALVCVGALAEDGARVLRGFSA